MVFINLKGIYRSILSLIGLGNSWQLNIAPQGLATKVLSIGHTICNIRNLCYMLLLDQILEAHISCYM
jgi:hypothetical protein